MYKQEKLIQNHYHFPLNKIILNVFVCKFTNLLYYYYTTEQYVATYEFQLSLLPDT